MTHLKVGHSLYVAYDGWMIIGMNWEIWGFLIVERSRILTEKKTLFTFSTMLDIGKIFVRNIRFESGEVFLVCKEMSLSMLLKTCFYIQVTQSNCLIYALHKCIKIFMNFNEKKRKWRILKKNTLTLKIFIFTVFNFVINKNNHWKKISGKIICANIFHKFAHIIF